MRRCAPASQQATSSQYDPFRERTKNSALAMLAGQLSPSGGTITIDGHKMGAMNEGERVKFRREKVELTFQANHLAPYLAAPEDAELMLRLNGDFDRPGKQRAEKRLARLGLRDRLKSLPLQLS
jgi:putative ABC transport system ATP-binding protein